MEEGGPHLTPGKQLRQLSKPTSSWQCMASTGPYGKNFRNRWRNHTALMIVALIFFPIVLPVMTLLGIFSWMAHTTSFPVVAFSARGNQQTCARSAQCQLLARRPRQRPTSNEIATGALTAPAEREHIWRVMEEDGPHCRQAKRSRQGFPVPSSDPPTFPRQRTPGARTGKSAQLRHAASPFRPPVSPPPGSFLCTPN
jgi:hypothetical protein